jgi:alpha-glucosidase (family GH31 glycosyl hydrolase)
MPNTDFFPGIRYTTMLFWTGDTMMSFDVLFEFVETVYRV